MAHENRYTFRVEYRGETYVFEADAFTEALAAIDLRSQCRADGFNLHECRAELVRVGRAS